MGMRRTTMLEIGVVTLSRYTQSPEVVRVVKKEPGGQECTIGRGRRSGGRVLKGEKVGGWSGRRPSPPEATREIPFHALGAHRKSRAFCAEFDIMHKSSAIRARISTVVFVVRASLRPAAHECIFPALRYVLQRCVTIYVFCILAFILNCLLIA